MAELFVYGDESGIDQQQGYCVVTGFIASPAQWDSFNLAWHKIVEDAGVAEFRSKYFFSRHAAAKEGTKNPFREWSDPMADRFLADLLQIIRSHQRVAPIGCAMRAEDWFDLSWGERQYLTGALWNGPASKFVTQGLATRAYPLPFFSMVGEALECAKPPDCKVHFVMDELKVIQNSIQQIYSAGRTSDQIDPALRRKMGDLTPGLSEEHEGIQAADLWAYALNGWYQHRGKLRGHRLGALMEIARRRGRVGGLIGSKGLERFLNRLVSPEDRQKMQAIKAPREIQRRKSP